MSAIGAVNPYASDISSLLSVNSSDPSQGAATGTPDIGSGNGHAPAARVDLSDKVKDILARAGSDRNVADRLEAFVESHRFSGADAPGRHDWRPQAHGFDVNQGFAQLSGAAWGDDGTHDDAPVEVAKNFATGLKA